MKKYILFFLISSILILPIAYLRKYSFAISFISCFIIYFVLGVYLLKSKKNRYKIILSLLLPILILYGYLHISFFKKTLISLPISLMPIIGLLLAIFYRDLKSKYKRIGFVSLIFLGLLCVYFGGYDYWVKDVSNYVYYNNFSGKVGESMPKNITLLNNNFEVVNLDSLSFKKIMVVDFWNAHCQPCFLQFPEFEKKAMANKNPNIEYYSVNIPISNTSLEVKRKLIKVYNFKKLYALDFKTAQLLGVKIYPTTLVIKNGKIIYRGELKNYNMGIINVR